MFDPKILYQDRTPAPLKDAPRDERPTVTVKERAPRSLKGRWFAVAMNWTKECQVCRVVLPPQTEAMWHSLSKFMICLPCFREHYPTEKITKFSPLGRRKKWGRPRKKPQP